MARLVKAIKRDSRTDRITGAHPVQPSAAIMISLYALVASTRQLGIPPGTNHTIVQDLVKSYVDAARALDGWKKQKEDGIVQAIVDLGFLGLLRGDKLEKDETVQGLIKIVSPA